MVKHQTCEEKKGGWQQKRTESSKKNWETSVILCTEIVYTINANWDKEQPENKAALLTV